MDVIVASATPPGVSALAVIRLSGAGLDDVLAGFVRLQSSQPWLDTRPRRVDLLGLDGHVIDDGVAIRGVAPATYTGEDTVEITCHGNPIIVDQLLQAACAAGARLAEPGAFTRRAVLNNKLDLVSAEAVEQVARAATLQGLAIARAGLTGALSRKMSMLRDHLITVTAELEARLDYPADELALETDAQLVERLEEVSRDCQRLGQTYDRGRRLVEGARVALVGPVNAGKSSLFNALLGRQRALVHDQAGTTRDVLEVSAQLGPVRVTLLDTAGERETSDPVEAAGLALAKSLVDEAELLLVVLRAKPEGLDETERQILERTADRSRLIVLNGIDRPSEPPREGWIATSAHTGQGIETLRSSVIETLVGGVQDTNLVASARQRDCLLVAARAVERAVHDLPFAGVAVAADSCTEALEALDELTGADTREDVLDALFSRFCIGK